METWKPVVGWEEVYEVSDFGRVRRIGCASGTHRGRLLRPRPHSHGYLSVSLCRNSKAKSFLIHRLVAVAFLGHFPNEKPEINHKNGNKSDNSLSNIEWATRSTNNLHAFRELGRSRPIGEAHPRAKLTRDQINEIRRLYDEEGKSQSVIASQFGISGAWCNRIVNDKGWKIPA
jgi:hypothetical protein